MRRFDPPSGPNGNQARPNGKELRNDELCRRAGDPAVPFDERADAIEEFLRGLWARCWGPSN
jgi:hypothetical protein